MSSEAEKRKQFEQEEAKIAHDPEGVPYFVIVNERYYLGMWFMSLPKRLCKYGAKQGDITLMIHRKLDTLTEWVIKMRFRYYLGADPTNPYNLTDKKDWNMFLVQGSEAEMDMKMRYLFAGLVQGANKIVGGKVHVEPPDFLELRCQGDATFAKMKAANKHWLHMKDTAELEKEKWFSRRVKAQLEAEIEKTKPGEG